MSEPPDLVALTQHSMRATNERDFDAAMAVFAEDAFFDVSEPGVGRFEGVAAVRRYLEDWIGSYERQVFRNWDGVDLGGGLVFVVAELDAQPAGSDASVRERWAFTVRWDGGAIVGVTAAQDIERARNAAADAAGTVGENAQVVIDGYARYNGGERVPALDYWHEDAEFHASSADPDSAVHSGIEAVRAQFKTWEEAYPDLRVEPLEVREGTDGRVFAWVRFVGHGANSGIPIDMQLAHVHTLRDGRATRLAEYTDRAEGLAAAGIDR